MATIERTPSKWLLIRHTHGSLDDIRDEEAILAALPNDIKTNHHVIRVPVHTSIKALTNVDWPALQKGQREAVTNSILDEYRKPQRFGIAYYGACYLPLAMDLGFRLRHFAKVTTCLNTGAEYRWFSPCSQFAAHAPPIRVTGVPEQVLRRFGDVVVRLSVSHRITAAETESMIADPIAALDVGFDNCSTSSLHSPDEMHDVARQFCSALTRLLQKTPRASRVHLFMSAPIGLAFLIGTLLNEAHTAKPIQTYKFMDAGRGYTPALVITGEDEQPPKTTIQFIAATQKGHEPLRIGLEHREIMRALCDGNKCSCITMLEPQLAAQLIDVQKWISRGKANIIHISGHGDNSGSLALNSKSEATTWLSSENLKGMFELLNDTGHIKCVVINACHSAVAAERLTVHEVVPVAIGASDTIDDGAAVAFARAFYRCLADGVSVKKSFECAQEEARRVAGSAEGDRFKFYHAAGVNSNKSIFEL